MSQVINVSGSFADGDTFRPAGGPANPLAVPGGVGSIDLTLHAGPMSGAATFFDGRLFLDRHDGNGFVDVAGVTGNGGLVAATRGGVPGVGVVIGSFTHFGVSSGNSFYFRASVANGPVNASATVDTNP